MKKVLIEPGLLPIFRLFTGIQLGLILIVALGSFLLPGEPLEGKIWMGSIASLAAFLLVYLSWPWLERRLGPFYLPLAVLVSSFITLVGQFLGMEHNFSEYISSARELSLVLVFPLLVTSWQYRFRGAATFSLGSGLVDAMLAFASISHADLISSHYLRTVFVRTVAFIAIGYVISRLVREQSIQRKALQQANIELAHYAATLEQLTVSRERNRIASELHDTVAHTLSGTAVQLEALKSLLDVDSEQAHILLDQALKAIRQGLTETRRALQALRASPLEDLGLLLALRSLAEANAARGGLAVEVQLPEGKIKLPPDVEQGIYRVAQEALENVVKHSEARHAHLQLTKTNSLLTLTIMDDGRGFEADKVDASHHFGLKGMHERARLMGGRLEVESQPEQGAAIRLMVEVDRDPNLAV